MTPVLKNVISEAVKFFHLNALSSPILVKVHFDVVMTMIADTLYNMLARKLRGFEQCDAPKIYRHFLKGKAKITIGKGEITVTFPRRAHNPILRAAPWHRLPHSVSWLDGANLNLKFSWTDGPNSYIHMTVKLTRKSVIFWKLKNLRAPFRPPSIWWLNRKL